MILFCFLQSYLLAIYICVFTDRITWFLQFALNIKFLIYHNDILVMLKYDFLFKIQLTYLQEKTYNSKICFKTIRMWGEILKEEIWMKKNSQILIIVEAGYWTDYIINSIFVYVQIFYNKRM